MRISRNESIEEALGFEAEVLAPILILRGHAYCGIEEIKKGLGIEQ